MKESHLLSLAEARNAFAALEKAYPNAKTELNYNTNFELLVAVILSAQCTDKRVNIVTDKLFKMYNTPSQFACLENEELEKMIYSCGFFRTKSRNIINASKDIVNKYDGKVPSTFDELISLDGVGRKTANVMLATAFNKEAFAVDTHVYRVSRRMGLSLGNTPKRVEEDVVALIGQNDLIRKHILLIFHGRYTCHPRQPSCKTCSINSICRHYLASLEVDELSKQ